MSRATAPPSPAELSLADEIASARALFCLCTLVGISLLAERGLVRESDAESDSCTLRARLFRVCNTSEAGDIDLYRLPVLVVPSSSLSLTAARLCSFRPRSVRCCPASSSELPLHAVRLDRL